MVRGRGKVKGVRWGNREGQRAFRNSRLGNADF